MWRRPASCAAFSGSMPLVDLPSESSTIAEGGGLPPRPGVAVRIRTAAWTAVPVAVPPLDRRRCSGAASARTRAPAWEPRTPPPPVRAGAGAPRRRSPAPGGARAPAGRAGPRSSRSGLRSRRQLDVEGALGAAALDADVDLVADLVV